MEDQSIEKILLSLLPLSPSGVILYPCGAVCQEDALSKKYKVIYADPPYSFRNKRTGGSMSSGSADQYSTLSLQELSLLPVSLVADKNSVCFLWSPIALLPDSLSLLSAWGYHYKTALFWRKIMSLGMGYWFRGQVEMCLLGIRGKVKAFRIQKPNFVQSKVRNHSQKPDEVRELIDLTGLSSKLELFAREQTPGWDAVGYDIDGKDIRVALAEKIAEFEE